MRTSPCKALLLACLALIGCQEAERSPPADTTGPFTIAVIPDTQNYVDYSHQQAEGFAIDGSSLFIAQMEDIARRSAAKGGDLVFAASVGDVWQHQTRAIDPEHAARGFAAIENPYFAVELEVTEQTREVEIPRAIEGYRILAAAGVPFGVAPGNHDYDAMWSARDFPPNLGKPPQELTMMPEDLGMLHIGGLENFRAAFGAESEFFRDAPWYVASYRGGVNSAQTFRGGGYTFLHIALEMSAHDDVLAWAKQVIEQHPGLPTIVTTHDYLDRHGERRPNPIIDLERLDPEHHNDAEGLWSKLIRRHDQIFLMLCGHQIGQSRRTDENDQGHAVHQLLADYQDRGRAGIDAGQPLDRHQHKPVGLGDGWYRLMHFDLAGPSPRIRVRTWSSHYRAHSGELASYADWYRRGEQPEQADAEFLAGDDFEIPLEDFRARFGDNGS